MGRFTDPETNKEGGYRYKKQSKNLVSRGSGSMLPEESMVLVTFRQILLLNYHFVLLVMCSWNIYQCN